jgi:peptide chain release factor 3
MLNDFVEWAPAPQPRISSERLIEASQPDFTGFVFKIQANMDPETPGSRRVYADLLWPL